MSSKKKKNSEEHVNKIENAVSGILNKLHLPYEKQVTVDKYKVDFLVEGKFIIECYGDFWHCNPQQYTSSYFNRGKKKTAEEIWARDAERKKKFDEMGYKFLCLWENEIRNNPKIIQSKIKKHIKLD